ncbi:hypothetical protein SAMN05880557_102422 [Pseudacidovorax sp. RU35E]|nr:hypothetical protein SAMN05880557_102422 [Pseudacidovorax sp. RU35E]
MGISVVQTLLTEGSGRAHANLAALVSPGNQGLLALPSAMNLDTATGLAVLNAEVTRHATLVAYLDDFWIMMVLTAVTIPLLVLIRRPKKAADGPAEIPH